MYAGASANVTIIVKQVSGVLTVPTAALHSAGGRTFVYLVKNGKQVKTFVTVGTTYGPSTQVTAGLTSGDKVAVTTTAGTRGPAPARAPAPAERWLRRRRLRWRWRWLRWRRSPAAGGGAGGGNGRRRRPAGNG